MSDSSLDLLIYIALTIGASAVGLLKSSKEKKRKSISSEAPLPEYEYEDESEQESVIILQQPEVKDLEDIFTPVLINEELSKKMHKKQEEGIAGFGRTDEERYAILEKRQQEGRLVRRKRRTNLLEEEEQEEISNEQLNKKQSTQFEFDIRQAVIASEILNRKY